jgi:glycosyltransferase involved in cell wall biosynthesis
VTGTATPSEVWRPASTPPPSHGSSPTFAVIVPTSGRESLARTLASILPQIQPGDEIIIECSSDNDWGNAARQRGVEAATASHILFCDDDDVFLPGALAVMRQFAAAHSNAIGIFRRRFNAGSPQWREPVLRPGNVQCMGFVIPNVRGKLGVWGQQSRDPERQAALEASGVRPWSDVYFVTDTAELQRAPVIFCDVVVGHARPEENPFRRLRYRLELRTRLRRLLKSGGQPPGAWQRVLLPPRPR